MKNLQDISNEFNQIMMEIEQEQETYWNSLTKEQQLQCFCAVVRRIYDGEIQQRGTYRYILYEIFGFGAESYTQAQLAGFLTLHNSIVHPEDLGGHHD